MKIKCCALALPAACACFAATLAAQPVTAPPPPGPPRPVTIATPAEQTLPNGLRVVVARRPGMPLVTAEILVQSGGEVDPQARAGLADLTATLLAKGTRKRSATAIAQAAESLGGSLDSGAGWHRSDAAITVTTPKLPAALELLADVTINPTFAQAELDRARKQALDALRVAMSEPGSVARYAAVRAEFGEGAYGHPLSGTPTSLPRIKRSDLIALHEKYYRPDNAVLVFAGDIEAQEAYRLAQTYFGKWARGKGALSAAPDVAGRAIEAPVTVIDMPDAGQAGVVVAMPAVARNAGDYYAGLVANTVLGGAYSSRLNQEIRIKRGLSYGATSRMEARRAGGQMIAVVQTKNPSAAEVLTLVKAELDRLAASAPDSEELTARKATLIGEFSRGLESTSGLAAQVASLAINGVPLDEISHIIGRIEAIGAQDVQTFSAAHWGKEKRRAVIAGNLKEFAEALKKDYADAPTIPLASLDLDRADLRQAARQ